MKRFRWDKKYLYWGVTAFLVIAGSILFFMLVSHLPAVKSTLKSVLRILSPFVWGLVIAYLLYPLQRIYDRQLFQPLLKKLRRKGGEEGKSAKLALGLSIFLSEISMLVIIAAVIWMIVPQLYQSIEKIIASSSDYFNTVSGWIDRLLVDYPEMEKIISDLFGDLSNGLLNWLNETVMPQFNSVLKNLTSGVYLVVKSVVNIFIGIIVSVYVLYNRRVFGAHIKKIIYCIFSVDAAARIIDAADFTNDVFMNYISGKLLDSLIIGIICYVGCSILKMPYTLLVSVIVGLTNIIPFFGPFIGAVPSAFIILMVSPLKCLIFILFILALQQFDGNILGPKILGNSVGINGFWVMFAIILGGGLFGFKGMLLGVPVFVVIYTLFKSLVNRKLKRSGLATETAVYENLDHIDPKTGEYVEKTETPRRRREAKKLHFTRSRKKTGEGEDAPPEPEDETPNDGQQP
ncbi:MAG: AI-2E family transporter [Oscillospiraceae bacterium]